jgi:hypothetical protein
MFNQGRCILLASTLLGLSGCAFEAAGPAGGVVVSSPPPVVQTEAIPVAPAPDYVWIDGAWVWNGAWVWRPGYWARRPFPLARWEPGRWEHWHRGYRWHEGRWR